MGGPIPRASDRTTTCWPTSPTSAHPTPSLRTGWPPDRASRSDPFTNRSAAIGAVDQEHRLSSEQKVAIITGASQGIGAGAVQAYRKLGYAVVANSRHITSSADPGVLTVPGDIADPETGGRVAGRPLQHFGPGGPPRATPARCLGQP